MLKLENWLVTLILCLSSAPTYGHRTGSWHAGEGRYCPDIGIESPKPSGLQTITDPSDPLIQNFSWEKATYVEKGLRRIPPEHRDTNFKETSKITEFSLKGRYGVCIRHTMHQKWLQKSGERVSYKFLIPTSGKVHSRWLHPPPKHMHCAIGYGGKFQGNSQQHLMWYIADWARSCSKNDSTTRDANRALDGWYPRTGEIVGFYVNSPKLKERSDVIWVRIPDYNKKGAGGEIVARYSDNQGDDPPTTTPPSTPDGTEGRCGPWKGGTDASCTAGKYHSHPPDTDGEYLWTCRNVPHNGEAKCKEAKTTTTPTTPTVGADCRTLRTQIPQLQRQLDEQLKAYRGKRLKKWFGLKRNSCKNVQLCETLANAIGLAQQNPSMASRIDSYRKRFRKSCKDFERCRGIAGAMAQIRGDLDKKIRTYSQRCTGPGGRTVY